MTLDATGERERVRTVEDLLERVEALPEPARGTAVDLVRGLLSLYGEALARITAAAGAVAAGPVAAGPVAAGAAGETAGASALAGVLTDDELVSHLLLLHGLHPLGAPDRIEGALRRLAPRLGRARVELVSVDAGVARLRISGSEGCGKPASVVDALLEDGVRFAAPEVERVEVVHVAAPPMVIPLDSLRQRIDGDGSGGRDRLPSRIGPDPA